MKLEKLNSCSPTMAEDKDTYRTVLALDRCAGLTVAHLYLVTLTRKIANRYPVVTMAYVIAPDEKEAIEQIIANAFPEEDSCMLDESQKGQVSATAVEIPFHIRGWGRQAF